MGLRYLINPTRDIWVVGLRYWIKIIRVVREFKVYYLCLRYWFRVRPLRYNYRLGPLIEIKPIRIVIEVLMLSYWALGVSKLCLLIPYLFIRIFKLVGLEDWI